MMLSIMWNLISSQYRQLLLELIILPPCPSDACRMWVWQECEMSLSNTAYHPNTLDLSVTASSASDDELNFLLHATGCYISNINANADAPNTNALFICFIVPQQAHGTLRNNFHKYPRTHNMVSIAIYMFSNYIPCMVASKLVYHWYGRSMQQYQYASTLPRIRASLSFFWSAYYYGKMCLLCPIKFNIESCAKPLAISYTAFTLWTKISMR